MPDNETERRLNASPETAPASPPVIALGTRCLTAYALRRLGLNEAPMPFDWLQNSPSMVRHCLETDFATLLDRSLYRSLTGKRGPNDPHEGCAHEYYARAHDLPFLFTHNDPTREADYRYLTTCIDRFRAVLSSGGPKTFVQIHHANGVANQDFEATASLLDKLTPNADLLQLVVTPPGTRLTLPVFTRVATHGRHTLYRMQPTSAMTGVDFFGPVDNEAIDGLIAAYAGSGRRNFAEADLVAAPASRELNLALENALLVAHIANRGDVKPDRSGWTGTPGSGLPVQGLFIQSEHVLIRSLLRYQAAETPTRFSAPVEAGEYAGTRGQNKAIYGLRVTFPPAVLADLQVSMEVSFVDGTRQGAQSGKADYEFLSPAPLEAVRLLVTAQT